MFIFNCLQCRILIRKDLEEQGASNEGRRKRMWKRLVRFHACFYCAEFGELTCKRMKCFLRC